MYIVAMEIQVLDDKQFDRTCSSALGFSQTLAGDIEAEGFNNGYCNSHVKSFAFQSQTPPFQPSSMEVHLRVFFATIRAPFSSLPLSSSPLPFACKHGLLSPLSFSLSRPQSHLGVSDRLNSYSKCTFTSGNLGLSRNEAYGFV